MGRPLSSQISTLVELARLRADEQGPALLYRFLSTGDADGPAEEWSFAGLDERARAVGAALAEAGAAGERALLVYPPGLEFVAGFFGCLYAGAVAVPTYPPDPSRLDRTLPRLRAIARDAGARFVLTTSEIAAVASMLTPSAPELGALRWVPTDALPADAAAAWRPPSLAADALAFLQYTSGSTGDPKGVMVTHANVLANERAIARAFRHDASSSGVGWLPLFHDMGLIGNVLQPLYLGFPCTLMSPLDFLRRPARWLEAVSRFGATTSGGPNFAYDLCVRKISPEQREALDLRRWEVAFNGAEPVRHETLERFAAAFAPCGFRRSSFYPCYGLAEATLIVSGAEARREPLWRPFSGDALGRGRAEEAIDEAKALPLVSSGGPVLDQRIVIVEPGTGAPCAERQVGEVWVAGENVARGYWQRPDETSQAFGARLVGVEGAFLRTGDLGFLDRGELFVTGRLKDVIIVRGRNHYPHDLERSAERAHPAVRPGCCAAFAWPVEGEEHAAIAAEVDVTRAPGGLDEVLAAVRAAIAEGHGLVPALVVLVAPQGVPKTSSGKLQRGATQRALQANELPILAQASGNVEAGAAEAFFEPAPLAERLRAADEAERAQLLGGLLRALVAARSGGAPDGVDLTGAPTGLGLDSLAMVDVEARLGASLGLELPAAFLWQWPTLEAAAGGLLELWRAAGSSPPGPPPPAAVAAEPVASSGQVRLWFLDRLLPESAAYNVQAGLRLTGELDAELLGRCLGELVARHEALRTTFVEAAGAPQPVVAPPGPFTLPAVDLRDHPLAERPAVLRELARAEAARPFDLSAGPLVRATLVRVDDDEHVLALSMHHIAVDGWSLGVLARELVALYGAARRGEPSPLRSPSPSYADYARWQRARTPELDAQRSFWRERLAGLPRLELPFGGPRASAPSSRGATLRFALPADVHEGLGRVGRRHGATPFVAMLAAFAALLSRYSRQSDFGVGVVVANRRECDRGLVGFVANTLVVRADVAGRPSFAELLRRTRSAMADALANAELPFDEVVRAARASAEAQRDGLVQVAVLAQDAPPAGLELPGLRCEPALEAPDASVEGTAKFDLALLLGEGPGGPSFALQYATDRFDGPSIERLAEHFVAFARSLAEAPERPLATLPLLGGDERRRALDAWNASDADVPYGPCVHHVFEEQARRTPDAPAVVDATEALTYAELDRRSDHLAARLRAAGVGPEDRVALYLDRSAWLVAAMLGVLKAGAAYVPLDPDYPADRVAFVVADSGARTALTRSHLSDDLPPGVAAICVDDGGGDAAAEAGASSRGTAGGALAYVIYTSGSTGRPKGVMVEHRSVVNFFAAMDARVGAEPPGTFFALTSVAFDISVLELLWTLARGFKVVVGEGPVAPRPGARSSAPRRALDFGLFYFADDEAREGAERYRLLLEGAKFADAHGFSAVWTPERHFHAFGGLYPNPSVTGAAVAAVTRRVGVRAGSVVLPLHHPVRVAEDWSIVDNLSSGRAGVSFATGWHADDFCLAPERYATRREAMLEGLDVVRRLWRGEALRLQNGAGASVEVKLRPRPVQRELPFWLTAAGSPETFRLAGELGGNVLTHLLGQDLAGLRAKIELYREARRAAGHAGEGRVTLMLHTYVERDAGLVRARAERPFRDYLKSSADLMRGFGKSVGGDVDPPPPPPRDLDALAARACARFFETGALFGTPRSCAELAAAVSSAGVNEVACLVDFGVDPEAMLSSLPHLDALRRRFERGADAPARAALPAARLAEQRVTHLQCTPSLARALVDDPDVASALPHLRALLVGGEALPSALAERLRGLVPGRLHSMYGPTETTIWSSTHPAHEPTSAPTTPLGAPIANTRLYVLDDELEPTPACVVGELYIGGDGVARGYHGRPGLTSERFVPDPFGPLPGARLYRTGDLVRRLADGTLEFVGRADQQVKLRGFRVELGEVEAALARHPGVAEAAALVREDRPGDRRLVAYVVPRGEAPTADALRAFVRERLPEYMVPSALVQLGALPRTPNGKLDRKALPAPEAQAASRAPFVAARNQLERQLAEVWVEVLGVEQVGVHDNFFDLGGHSLLLAQVHAKLRASLAPDLALVTLVERPTVAALAAHLSGAAAAGAEAPRAAQSRANAQLEAMRRRQRAREAKG